MARRSCGKSSGIEPPTPREVRRDIPAELETVILKAMAKDRGERYATAQELADDLRRVLDGKPTLARPATVTDLIGRWSRRHRRMVGLGVGALVLALVGLTASTLMIAREKARAENNVVRADRYFRDARQVLDRFGVQLAERLADVPGAEEVRQELLQETREYYESFVNEAKSDPKLRADMALTYGKIATLLDEVGTPDEAAAAHRQALEVFAELAAANPQNQEYQKRLAQCGNNLALALARAGRSDEARRQWAQAIARQQRLVASAPGER